MSRIITFYSYKGGVGRTFSLANIAVLLAKRGKRVLIMDWDLEAPGLHRYFKPYLTKQSKQQLGLIHMLHEAAINPNTEWLPYVEQVKVENYPAISLVSSGDSDPEYIDRVRGFSWEVFFQNCKGGMVLERWREEWKEHYDFILIDSRTGITDTGGVCTVFLPDILVLVFSANEQSFEGGLQVAKGIQEARKRLSVPRLPMAVLPLLGRFDGRDEVDEADKWMNRFARELKPFYDVWLSKKFQARQLLELTKLPYVTKFSFGEPLPVISHGVSDPEFPGFYLDNNARILASDFQEASMILMPESVKLEHPSTPDIWHMSHQPNPYFTGREDVLFDLHERLKSGGRAALSQSREAISALGGMGKTQTAIEYAYRYASEYSAVLWVLADTRANMLTAMVAVAAKLGLATGEVKDQKAVAQAVIKWLDQGKGWLLILDNVEDAEEIAGLLPTRGDGHVIVTSRKHELGAIGIQRPLELNKMSATDAREFLMRRTERKRPEGDELYAVDDLVREFDFLPLAIEQAGAYIKKIGCGFREYHAEFKTRGVKLLDKIKPILGMYPASVLTTWNMNFEQINKASPVSEEILYLSAFMHPEEIPQELFTLGGMSLNTKLNNELSSGGTFKINELLAPLDDYSLVKREPENKTFDIHRLVQGVIRHILGGEEEKAWAERAVLLLNAAYPDVKFSEWRLCERITPHALSIFDYIDRFEIKTEAAARLFNQTGEYLYYQGHYAEAGNLFKKSVAIRENILGFDHLDVSRPLNNLALVYQSHRRYPEAEPLFKRALKIREEKLESDHPEVALSLDNLAGLYKEQGRYSEAESLCNRAIKIREEKLGPDHPDVAISLNNLATLYQDQGRYSEAEPLYNRALKIKEEKLGPDHPDVALSLNNLATLYKAQGKHSKAELLYNRALEIREEKLGPNHPDVARSLTDLARLYQDEGRYLKAESLYKKAMLIAEKALGNAHPDLANIYKNYVACLRKLKHSQLAKKYEKLAAEVMRRHEALNKPKH